MVDPSNLGSYRSLIDAPGHLLKVWHLKELFQHVACAEQAWACQLLGRAMGCNDGKPHVKLLWVQKSPRLILSCIKVKRASPKACKMPHALVTMFSPGQGFQDHLQPGKVVIETNLHMSCYRVIKLISNLFQSLRGRQGPCLLMAWCFCSSDEWCLQETAMAHNAQAQLPTERKGHKKQKRIKYYLKFYLINFIW